MRNHLIFILLLLPFVIGCQSKFPANWPKIYPCKIQVVQNGVPIAGVDVTLIRVSDHGSWAVSGRTDQNGNAEIETSWTKAGQKGAPEGTFKVVLFKPLEPEVDSTPPERLEKMNYAQRKAHEDNLFEKSRKRKPALPPIFSDGATTPVQIEVGPEQPADFSIDLDEYAKK